VAQLLNKLKIFNRPASTSVCNGNSAPFRKLGDELVIDTALKTFDIRGVNEKLRAVGFEEGYGVCGC
jgi:hypothetical protein